MSRKPAKSGSRKKMTIGSHITGPVILGLAVVFMTAWLAFSFFMPDVETKAAQASAIKTAQPQQTKALGGRLFQENSSSETLQQLSEKAAMQNSGQPQKMALAANAAKSLASTSSYTRLDQIGRLPGQTKAKRDAAAKAQKTQPTAKTKPMPQPAPSRTKQNQPTEQPAAQAPAAAAGNSSAPSAVMAASSGLSQGAKPATLNADSRKEPLLGGGRAFTVHLDSFVERENAERRISELKAAQAHDPKITETTLNGQHWYRVTSGRFTSRSDAERYGSDLKRRGLIASTGHYLVKSVE